MRVIRAAKSLGMDTVAVYSDDDKFSPHVRLADDAVGLGAGPALENYLNVDAIINAARKTDADAIHPGYGFLSESAVFAQRVIDEGLKWVGPPPSAIRKLADKVESRKVADAADVPITPGSDAPVEADKAAMAIAKDIGYPIMVKAAHGGGGIGMQVVRSPGKLRKAIKATQRQSQAAFGNGEIFLERYVESPRHIEVQFFADNQGHVVHLGERECSIQRRHQKLLEEAPSTAINDEERQHIGAAVKQLAKNVGYVNAGTAEFLYKDGEFFFNEVNARLQVEHPVTEMITGKDLVLEQLSVAAGNRLSWRQEDIQLNGHAIEARICAEDPIQDFLPTPGRIRAFVVPGGPGIRFDTHVYQGYKVPRRYDPMIGKLLAWGENREQSRTRLLAAVKELAIVGISTNEVLFAQILDDPWFIQGKIHTEYVEKSGIVERMKEEYRRRVAALFATRNMTSKIVLPKREESNWSLAGRVEASTWVA